MSAGPLTAARRAAGRPLAGPIAAGVTLLGGWAALAALGPAASPLPSCPMHAVTGLWCPLCGGTRAADALSRGDLAAAASSNLLVVLAVPVAAWLWARWLLRRRSDPTARLLDPSARLTSVVALLLLAFAVLRNLPAGGWFAPGP